MSLIGLMQLISSTNSELFMRIQFDFLVNQFQSNITFLSSELQIIGAYFPKNYSVNTIFLTKYIIKSFKNIHNKVSKCLSFHYHHIIMLYRIMLIKLTQMIFKLYLIFTYEARIQDTIRIRYGTDTPIKKNFKNQDTLIKKLYN